MSSQVRPFLDHMLGYYRPAPQVHHTAPQVYHPAPQPAYNHNRPQIIPYVIHAGGNTGGHHVQVIATDPQTVREIRRNEEEDRQNANNTLAAVIGGIFTVVFAGVAAFAGRALINSQKELDQAIEFKNQELLNLDQQVQNTLSPILNKHIENLESQAFWSKTFVVLTAGALICAGSAFVGGMLSLPWLVTAAVVGGVGLAAISAFSAVWYCTEDNGLSPQMLQQIEDLRAQHLS